MKISLKGPYLEQGEEDCLVHATYEIYVGSKNIGEINLTHYDHILAKKRPYSWLTREDQHLYRYRNHLFNPKMKNSTLPDVYGFGVNSKPILLVDEVYLRPDYENIGLEDPILTAIIEDHHEEFSLLMLPDYDNISSKLGLSPEKGVNYFEENGWVLLDIDFAINYMEAAKIKAPAIDKSVRSKDKEPCKIIPLFG